jgi:hypothetical protein
MLNEQILQAVRLGAEKSGVEILDIGENTGLGLVLSEAIYIDADIVSRPTIPYTGKNLEMARRMFGDQPQVDTAQYLRFESVVAPPSALSFVNEERLAELYIALLENFGPITYGLSQDRGLCAIKNFPITHTWDGSDMVTPDMIRAFTDQTLDIFGEIEPFLRDAIHANFIAPR